MKNTGKNYDAIWDTGASRSYVSYKVIEELNLSSIPDQNIAYDTPHGYEESPAYSVDIILSTGILVKNVIVGCTKMNRFDVIIGMDIISLGDFAISNYNGITKFSFRIPSKGHIDFAEEDKCND